ncbi:MAG: DMT family transporter [Thermoleophilaceae bacterium]|nr:DMT family transporter [Thermoleophilaceae bacterium]
MRATAVEQAREDARAVFAPRDWAMLAGTAVTWGGSFLFIDLGLEHFAPPLIAFGRIAIGAATLALIPAARQPVPRSAWPQIALLGLKWMAIPFLLLAVAQQWIDTGVAGMVNASAPLFTALVGALLVRALPSRLQGIGLVLGFLGVVAISLPSVEGGSNLLGVLLVLSAAVLYGFAFNVAAPLQGRHGSLPVTLRAMFVAAVALLPAAFLGALESSFGWSSLVAVVALPGGGRGARCRLPRGARPSGCPAGDRDGTRRRVPDKPSRRPPARRRQGSRGVSPRLSSARWLIPCR